MTTHSILKHATDEQLGLAVFENLHDLFQAMAGKLPKSELVEEEKLSYHLLFPRTQCSKVSGMPDYLQAKRTRPLT